MAHRLLFSGSSVLAPVVPDGATIVHPPGVQPGLADVRAAALRALEEPLDGAPLFDRVRLRDRVLLVFDSPGFPVPPARSDPRGPIIQAILQLLADKGLALDQITLMCASGLSRLYRPTELASVAGVTALASHPAHCHDAEDGDQLALLGATSLGEPVELNAALSRADLVISVSVAQAPIQGGWSTLAAGLASARTAKVLSSAEHLAGESSPFALGGSSYEAALSRVGEVISRKVPVFHVEAALDTRLFSPAATAALSAASGELPGPLSAWNRIPERLRLRASRLVRGEYQTIDVWAGSTDAVRRRVLEALRARSYTRVDSQADVVVVGLPAIVPGALGASDNPVLAASAAFGWVLGWHQGTPLVREGGSVVLLSPLAERFERPIHQVHYDFFEQVLSQTRDPAQMLEAEALFCGRPEYVAAYRRKHAFHGLHPFAAWYLAAGALRRIGQVVAVGAAPRSAERLGFEAAATFEEAIARARERSGGSAARVAILGMPPAFGISVG